MVLLLKVKERYWHEWYDYIKTTFKTNKVKFREDKLKLIVQKNVLSH